MEYHSVKEWDGSISEKCYKFVVEELTWKEARKSCQLASIPNEQINDALFELSHDGGLGHNRGAWNGAYHDFHKSYYSPTGANRWMWSDGSQWNYYNWGDQEPKTLDGHVEHVKMRSKWYTSESDDETNSYFCQKDVVGKSYLN